MPDITIFANADDRTRPASKIEQTWDRQMGARTSELRKGEACPSCEGRGSFSMAARGINRRTMCLRCMGTGNKERA